ncbi:hypothetical protein PAECIP111893_04004 [Paenibacillus plantiphilus]|uniref:Uncharacterized protein n=1 Tax=Paenibacillus plantiphilus TaxID=2905650 RepID=A0ABM9CKR0_9BACL|nr:hypothetical protein PAECIP111893_04004 [Paenibacillus plantiphilus]
MILFVVLLPYFDSRPIKVDVLRNFLLSSFIIDENRFGTTFAPRYKDSSLKRSSKVLKPDAHMRFMQWTGL